MKPIWGDNKFLYHQSKEQLNMHVKYGTHAPLAFFKILVDILSGPLDLET